jgi:hypothetical protein
VRSRSNGASRVRMAWCWGLLVSVSLPAWGQLSGSGRAVDAGQVAAPSGAAPSGAASSGAAPSGAEPTEELESFESVASPALSEEAAAARVFARVAGKWGLDTAMEPAQAPLAENVSELWLRAALGADVKLSRRLRLVAEGRISWRGTVRRGGIHAKGTETLDVGETFVDVYSDFLDLRVGNQVFALGANAAFAPTDVLNPKDLREGFLPAEVEDAKLPVFGLRALVHGLGVDWTLVFVPFFQPHRYDVFGSDWALLQPGAGVVAPLSLDPSIEDLLQPRLLETSRPRAFPWQGDLALRATRGWGGWKFGASWVWFTQKLPEVTVDPELAAALEREANGLPPDPALLLSLQNRARAGETLLRGDYSRQHLLGLEVSRLVGSAQVDLDVAYSPRQTFVNATLAPVRLPSLTWVVGITPAEETPWVYGLSYLGLAAFDLPPNSRLWLLEAPGSEGGARSTTFHLLAGVFGYRFLDRKLEVSCRAAVELVQGSFWASPTVSWAIGEAWTVWVAGELVEGSPESAFGYFRRNDQVVAGFSWRL